ncbi:hypothetical protein E2562_023101 [Oryza meyeriana var. granulata]|uniref:Uncharacterized protein n=1 Tax=Oryza meyeriana var. granulata TaxID=110450 RepID=A0A6G1E0Z0_9ORYZ|nr:hypothetical protein E2562_023101 [Oryza meyeriana var. granulata]
MAGCATGQTDPTGDGEGEGVVAMLTHCWRPTQAGTLSSLVNECFASYLMKAKLPHQRRQPSSSSFHDI